MYTLNSYGWMGSGWMGTAAAWLFNYLVHSTLLLGGAWLASRWLAGRRTAAEEWLWRSALLGGLVTASLQLAFGGALARAPLPSSEPRPAIELAALAAPPPVATAADESAAVTPQELAPAAVVPLRRRALDLDLSTVLLALWAAGAAFFVARLAARWVAFRRRLAGRRAISGGPLAEMLSDLTAPALGTGALGRRAVRLTATRRFPVPFARGTARPEICMPERAVLSLEPAFQRGILAHEVAHLVRRDPLWLAALRLAEALFFFQPLHRVASRRLLELSEYHCDDWAARATGRGKELARCLTEVAAWLVDRPAALPVPAMARSRSSLARRIERLLADRAGEAAEHRMPRWALPLAALVLAAMVAFAPGLTLAGGADDEEESFAAEPVEETAEPETPEAEWMPEPAWALEPELAPPTPRPHLAPTPEVWPTPDVTPMPEMGPTPHVAPMPGHRMPAEPRLENLPAPQAWPTPRPVTADAWAPPPPAPDAPPAPRAPRALPPGQPPPALAPEAPPAPPNSPIPPRAPRPWDPANELSGIADAMEELASEGEVPAEDLARLLRHAARVALRAGAISDEEHERLAAASARRAAEASRSPTKVAEMAAETRAIAESLARRPRAAYPPRPRREARPGEARAPRPGEWEAGMAGDEWRAMMDQARQEALRSVEDQRVAIEQALAQAREQIEREQAMLAEHMRDVARELELNHHQVEQEVRSHLERELHNNHELSDEAIEREVARVRAALDRALVESRAEIERGLERARRDLLRAEQEMERSGHREGVRSPRPPRPPRAEETPAPEAEVEEPVEPPA